MNSADKLSIVMQDNVIQIAEQRLNRQLTQQLKYNITSGG
jgi:hypothetical protein